MSYKDIYKTIKYCSDENILKIKKSKFFGYAFPVSCESEIILHLNFLKDKHRSAHHFCYAWKIGVENEKYRVNDDGEPINSAGMPIYRQIKTYELTNILIVIVRYFGGIKLGVGGLILAYKNSAKLVIEKSEIIVKTIDVCFIISFDYNMINKIEKIIKEKIISVKYIKQELICHYTIIVRKKEENNILNLLKNLYKVKIKKIK